MLSTKSGVSGQLSGAPRRGFTLIEILIVIAIIGFIAALSSVVFRPGRTKSRDTKRVNDLSQIRKALEFGYRPGGGYPVHASPIHLGEGDHRVICAQGADIKFAPDDSPSNCDADKIYMGLIPADPDAPDLHYSYTGTPTSFCIEAVLQNDLGDLQAGTIVADDASVRNGTCP